MAEPEKEDKSERENAIVVGARKAVPRVRDIIAIAAALATISVGVIVIKDRYFSKAIIEYTFARYNAGKVAVYQGELINTSSTHANGVTLKGRFNSKIIRLDVDTNDFVESQKINSPTGSVAFSLRRLSRDNKCLFSIIVDTQIEIIEQLYVSWDKDGCLSLSLQQADQKIQKAFDLGKDLSRNARLKWFRNNAQKIR
jgi:hypothetical protein